MRETVIGRENVAVGTVDTNRVLKFCAPSIDIEDFATLGKDFAESFLRFSKMIPSDKDLRIANIEMNRWNNYKDSMTKSI